LAIVSIFVGNLPWATSDQDLQELFSQYGEVKRAKIVLDRETNRSRGFGFIDMEEECAQAAIAAWNEQLYGSRTLTVNLAQSRPARG
jgi:RNA recognition motif-containing protein